MLVSSTYKIFAVFPIGNIALIDSYWTGRACLEYEKTWILFTSRSRQKCNIWHIFTSHAKERLLIVNVSIFTTFSVRKRLSNVKLLRQIYLVNKFTVNAVFAIFNKSIELVLKWNANTKFNYVQKGPKPSKWKILRLVGYLVFLAQMSCKCVLTHHICCMSKHETLAKTLQE